MKVLPRSRARRISFLAVALAVLAIVPHGATANSTADPLMYGGGAIMATSATHAIFWLPTLGGQATQFEPSGSDATYESLIERFLGDVDTSTFYNIVTQYPGGTSIWASSRLGGSWVDSTAPASGDAGTQQQPLQDADVQAEVQLAMQKNGWTASPTTLFLVYTGATVESCADLADSQCSWNTYCAYHASFVPSGSSQPVYYAAVPDPGANSGQCLAQTGSGAVYPNNDALADSAISLTSRELFAAVTDPGGDGWSDSSGAEIDGKCAWDFGTINGNGSNVTLNGHPYLLQREWSNADNGCVLSYGTVAPTPTPTPTPGSPATRLTPTPPISGTPTPTPTSIAGQANRLTPTPPVAGTSTPTPTPAGGISRRPGLLYYRLHLRALRREAHVPKARQGRERWFRLARRRASARTAEHTLKGTDA